MIRGIGSRYLMSSSAFSISLSLQRSSLMIEGGVALVRPVPTTSQRASLKAASTCRPRRPEAPVTSAFFPILFVPRIYKGDIGVEVIEREYWNVCFLQRMAKHRHKDGTVIGSFIVFIASSWNLHLAVYHIAQVASYSSLLRVEDCLCPKHLPPSNTACSPCKSNNFSSAPFPDGTAPTLPT